MKTYQTTQTLKDDNFFLTYPREMMYDINNKYPEAIIDYEVNGNDLTLTLSDIGQKNLTAINSLIANMKG